jgi:group I intron endonuclease
MIGIYKITSPSNRIYIGQSVNIEKRFTSYKRMYVKNQKQTKLYRSFLKYGVINHTFELIYECLELELNHYERHYQELFNCLMDIKRELDYHIGNVSRCLKGNLKTYKKFKWKYKC